MTTVFLGQGIPSTTILANAFTSERIDSILIGATKTDTNIQANSGPFTINYDGEGFTFDGDNVTGGRINGFSESYDGNVLASISGSNVYIKDADMAKAKSDDDLLTLVFQGDDNMSARTDIESSEAFVGNFGNDTIVAGPGADIAYGNENDDIIFGNQGNDSVIGGQGNDTVIGGKDDDYVYGNKGNDVTFGNEGQDTIFAGQGDDTVFAGKGDDLIFGNQGSDTLFGNDGADTFKFAPGDGADLVTDFSRSSGDLLDVQGLSHTTSQAANGDAVITLFGGGTIELQGIAAAAVTDAFFTAAPPML